MKIKNTEIRFLKGDITQSHYDGLVIPSQASLKMTEGLSVNVKQKGGKKIEDDAVQKGPIKVGDVIWTQAGKLKARCIIHVAVYDQKAETNEAVIRHACQNILKCADELKLRSVALPALGCGIAGFPVMGSAKIMAQEIMKHLRLQPTSLRSINFYLNEEETFRIFEQTVSGYVTHIQDQLGEGPYVTVDIIIESKEGLVLVERSNPPYGWALPGGFVDYGETLEKAAIREAKEETHLELVDLRQFHAYSSPGRDPRFHTVSTVFIAQGKGNPKAGDDAKNLRIVKYKDLLKAEYAFDHKKIIEDYLKSKKMV